MRLVHVSVSPLVAGRAVGAAHPRRVEGPRLVGVDGARLVGRSSQKLVPVQVAPVVDAIARPGMKPWVVGPVVRAHVRDGAGIAASHLANGGLPLRASGVEEVGGGPPARVMRHLGSVGRWFFSGTSYLWIVDVFQARRPCVVLRSDRSLPLCDVDASALRNIPIASGRIARSTCTAKVVHRAPAATTFHDVFQGSHELIACPTLAHVPFPARVEVRGIQGPTSGLRLRGHVDMFGCCARVARVSIPLGARLIQVSATVSCWVSAIRSYRTVSTSTVVLEVSEASIHTYISVLSRSRVEVPDMIHKAVTQSLIRRPFRVHLIPPWIRTNRALAVGRQERNARVGDIVVNVLGGAIVVGSTQARVAAGGHAGRAITT